MSGVHTPLDVPDEHATTAVAVSAEPWPSDASALAFAWANAQRDNCWYCMGQFANANLLRHGAARIDRDGSLLLAGGSYVARLDEGVSPWPEQVHSDCRAALSIELTIRLREGGPPHADLINIGPATPGGSPLILERNWSEIRLAFGGKRLVIGRITNGARHHIVVSCHDARAYAFLDGTPTGVLSDLSELPGRDRIELAGAGWQGSIEGIAVYRRALAQDEIARNRVAYDSMIAGIKEVKTIRIHAVLSARSLIPELGEIRPYRDALVVCEYDTNPEHSNEATRIYVAQWGIIDGVRTPLADLASGSVCDLELEDIVDHPELESAWLADTLTHLPSAPIFVEAGR